MKKILVLNTSLTGTSLEAAKFLETQRQNDQFTFLDLNEKLSNQLLTSKTLGDYTNDSDEYIDMLKNADEIILLTSMVELFPNPVTISYLSKIVVIKKTFAYNSEGVYAPLASIFESKKVQIIFTSGSKKEMYYEPTQQIPNALASVFKFIGFKDIVISWLDGMDMPEIASKTRSEKIMLNKNKLV